MFISIIKERSKLITGSILTNNLMLYKKKKTSLTMILMMTATGTMNSKAAVILATARRLAMHSPHASWTMVMKKFASRQFRHNSALKQNIQVTTNKNTMVTVIENQTVP